MQVSSNRVLIWSKGLDDFLLGSARFNGGIAVQLALWAKTFRDHGWTVYTLSEHANATVQGIHFVTSRTRKGLLGVIADSVAPLVSIVRLRPRLLLFRGASRNLFFVSFWARLMGVRVVFMGASDTDFRPGAELMNREYDKRLYRRGLNMVDRIVVQSQVQGSLVGQHYQKGRTILIPNIWKLGDRSLQRVERPSDSVIWVGNFRSIKRPELFLGLAGRLPGIRFVMIGGAGDRELYDRCSLAAAAINNLEFLGSLPFEAASDRIQQAALLVCTSETEGFPNTFLQAWSCGVPVVTTFDLGGLIHYKRLGLVATNLEDLVAAVRALLEDTDTYKELQRSISAYFADTHCADRAFARLTEFALA